MVWRHLLVAPRDSSFSGFAEGNDEAHEARVKKLKDSRKWTVAALKDLCTLLGLDKGGSKVCVCVCLCLSFCVPFRFIF